MSENDTEVARVVRKKRPSLKKRVGLAAAATSVVAIGLLGGNREAKPVSAESNTPTAPAAGTVTPTSTPNIDQRIAAMQTVVAKAVEDSKKEKILGDLVATATVLAETPIATPKPADVEATRTARQDEAYGKERAGLEAEYLKTHPPTPTPRPTFAPTPAVGAGGNEGGFPWGWVIGLPVIGGAVYFFRNRIGGFIGGIKGKIGRSRTPPSGGTGRP